MMDAAEQRTCSPASSAADTSFAFSACFPSCSRPESARRAWPGPQHGVTHGAHAQPYAKPPA